MPAMPPIPVKVCTFAVQEGTVTTVSPQYVEWLEAALAKASAYLSKMTYNQDGLPDHAMECGITWSEEHICTCGADDAREFLASLSPMQDEP
jgi:hypothetical protein